MTNWDEIIIADYESKWLDPDYDWENRCYRSDEEIAETAAYETPCTDEEEQAEYEKGLRHEEMRRKMLARRYA